MKYTSTTGLLAAFLWAFLLMIAFTLCGCHSIREVHVPEYHDVAHYVIHDRTYSDSVYIIDSTRVRVIMDTIYQDKWRTEHHYHDRVEVQHDTTIVRDSIPVIVYKEKSLSRWNSLMMDFGKVCCGLFMCFLLILCFTTYKKIWPIRK